MWRLIVRRFLLMIPTLIAISIISFVIIQAPPGDFVSYYIDQLETLGERVDESEIAALKERYGLSQPMYVQYFKWMAGLLRGDLGRSLQWNRPVAKLIAERLPWSITISFVAFVLVYVIGIPFGAIAATRQHTVADYAVTVIGFVGLAIPNFLFALILLWLIFVHTGNVAVGLFSPEFERAPWSIAKLLDLLQHLWVPAIIVGTAGTAGLIRVMRANLLDELHKPYVMVARAKGLSEQRVLYKYPFRVAINPVVSTIGWTLPQMVNGELLTSLVLNLPTLAPIFLGALLSEDMFLAGSIVFILSTLTVFGTLLSDILLGWVDPRIRESI